MEGFYRLNNAVLKFDPIKDIDKIIFNQYIMRCEIESKIKKCKFSMSYSEAAIDLNMSISKVRRLVKKFIELGIIRVVSIFPSNMRKPSVYEYIHNVSYQVERG